MCCGFLDVFGVMLNSYMKWNSVPESALLLGGKKVIPPETLPRALNNFTVYFYPHSWF